MEHELPVSIWSAAVLAGTACLGSIVLSVQRRFHHHSAGIRLEEDLSTTRSPLKYDHLRDYTVPFADDTRLTRVLFGTIVMTALKVYDFYDASSRLLHGNRSDGAVYNIICISLVCVSWFYILALAIVSRHYQLPNKWGFVLNIHLFVYYMTSLCVSLYCLWDAFRVHHSQLTLAQGLPLVLDILFSLDLFYTTGSIEQGPPHLDVDGDNDDYKDGKPAPVAGITVASIFSLLYFNWGTPIVLGVYNNAQNIRLPSLPPTYRGHNLYYMFGARRDRSLVYRLIHANMTALILQSITTAISAALYYGPAYFLNKLLNLIQDIDSGKQDEFYLIKGLMIVSGLSLSLMVLSIVVGQLYYWGSSSLRVKVKSMLNIELYRKTLRRIGTADMHREANDNDDELVPKTEATAAADTANENNAAGEGHTNTIGTIVNLMSTDSQRISDFTTSWFVIIESPIELIVGISFLYSLLGSSCLLGLSVMIITLPLNHFNSIMFAKTQEKLMEARDKRVSLMNEVLQGIRQIKFFAWELNWEKRVMEARDVEIKHLQTTFLSEVLFNLLWQGTPLLVTIVTFFTFTKIQGQELTAPIAFTAITVFTELRSALNSLPETFVDTLQALISVRRIESYLNEEEISPPTTNLDPNCRVRIGFRNATVSWVDVPSDDEEDEEDDVNTATAVNSGNNSLQIPRSTSTVTFQSVTPAPSTYQEADTFILHNLDAHFPNGKFSIICGATGSGKTLMMLSLLGETVLLEGESFCPRTAVADILDADMEIPANITRKDWILDHAVAYVSQNAWLRNASIRDNILFGLPFIEKRYKETLYACALDKDMDNMEDGDLTEVGEKGITLSGGQRARVALARAVYSRARNVLLDDVLSAVDAHTARHLHDKCLVGPLMEGRTRILITHHVGLCVHEASYVIHIENGRINLCGSPEELEAEGKLESILDDVVAPTDEDQEDTIEEEAQQLDPELVKPADVKRPSDNAGPKVLIKEETRNVGHIKLRLYKLYFRALGGSVYWIIVFAFVFGSRALDVAESWWIKKWVASNEVKNIVNTAISVIQKAQYFFIQQQVSSLKKTSIDGEAATFKPASHSRGFGLFSTEGSDQLDMYLTIYILITMTNIVVGAGRFASLYYGTLRASKNLYQQLLRRVLRAPMRFFDTTPIGRILNRFSKDFEFIDSGVPNDLMYFLIQWLVIISAIMTVCIVLPAFVIPMALVTFLNVIIGKRFSAASRELRRMDSVTRSPLFTHFGETLVGVATIRAYGVTRQFMNEMLRRVDANARPFYYVWIANRWVGVRFSFLGAAVNFCTGVFILLSLSYMDASLAGFCLSFVLSYTTQMTMAIKRYTRVEMSFNAVERVVEFMEIEQESPATTALRPPPHWPVEGRIDVQNLKVRYAPDLDFVLKDLTFALKSKEKVGVVGRTGSGKSTLALSFFRFVEPTEGTILIDGIDICQIGTEDLRGNITIIPQDPVLFSGTLRSNLDPFQEFDEESIMAALKRVELLPSDEDVDVPEQGDSHHAEDLTSNVFADLESPVSEGGHNFSQGQRQLLCLARALLKRNRIVLMDEATASVDFETDEAIQKTIATEFADCTILCIAHRLRTVIEYDKILVLDQGEIAEFASPLDLLNTPNSIFSKMCENSGEYETLVALAKKKHELIGIM
ncbi:P-loop containing nucleoside triphosphate hydrolase protein [Parasitella parasitica]|nr:P-loop containing nucleoside triphosphate hydrolase protein [Parasitella parasitica]